MNAPQPAPKPNAANPETVAAAPPAEVQGGVVLPAGWDVVSKDGQTTAVPAKITAACDECGETAQFPTAANGTIQKCPACEEWMDVGGEDWYAEAEAAGNADDLLPLLGPSRGCGCGPTGCGTGGCG